MNLSQIFRTLDDFLNEYDLPDTYATAFPNEDFPAASLVYLGGNLHVFPPDLAWQPIGDCSVAEIIYNGLNITIQTDLVS